MAGDGLRAPRDQAGARVFGDVVVIEVETPTRKSVQAGELMELIEVRITDQMRPQPVVCGPTRVVDQNGHGPSVARSATRAGSAFAQTPTIR